MATIEAMTMVAAATQISQRPAARPARCSMPNRYTATLRTLKTPALTTATACRSALTGAGATIAAGSQWCSGMSAALPMPKT